MLIDLGVFLSPDLDDASRFSCSAVFPGVPPMGIFLAFHDRGSCYRRAYRHRQKWISRFSGRNDDRPAVPPGGMALHLGTVGRATGNGLGTRMVNRTVNSVFIQRIGEHTEAAEATPQVMDFWVGRQRQRQRHGSKESSLPFEGHWHMDMEGL